MKTFGTSSLSRVLRNSDSRSWVREVRHTGEFIKSLGNRLGQFYVTSSLIVRAGRSKLYEIMWQRVEEVVDSYRGFRRFRAICNFGLTECGLPLDRILACMLFRQLRTWFYSKVPVSYAVAVLTAQSKCGESDSKSCIVAHSKR